MSPPPAGAAVELLEPGRPVAPAPGTTEGPSDTPSAPRRAARVAGLVLGLVAIGGLPFARIGDAVGPGRRALAEHGPVALLVVGDSRPHVAISPAGLASALAPVRAGLPMLNVAEDGTDTLHQALLVRAALDRPHPPAVVLWAVDPQGFDGSRVSNRLERVGGDALPWLVRAGAPLELCLDVALGAIYPPYRHRPMVKEKVQGLTDQLGEAVARLQAGFLGLSPRPPTMKGRRYEPQPDGWEPFVVTADGPGRFARGLAAYEVDNAGLRLADWHFALVRMAAREAAAHGTVVVFLEMPVAPVYRRAFGADPRVRGWQSRIRALALEEGQVFISQVGRYATAEPFGDPGHLTRAGAEAYLPELAEALATEPRVTSALGAW